MSTYQVIVSNIGTVYTGKSLVVAKREFSEYVSLSESMHGKIAGESVTMFCDGEIIKEFIGAEENDKN